METLQPQETSLIFEYFDIKINVKGTIVTLTLKQSFKIGKDVPIKKLRPNGQKVVENGKKYFQHYLGIEVGEVVFNVRKRLYSMYCLLHWTLTSVKLTEDERSRIEHRLSELHSNNSTGLVSHYSSEDGIVTKQKLKERNKKWSKITGKMLSDMWKDDGYRNKMMKLRTDQCLYERSSETMKKKYSDPIFRAYMDERANDCDRKSAISLASKRMWENARNSDLELYRRMTSSGGKRNYEVNGVKMNSIEYMIATTLNELDINWEYGKPLRIGDKVYIPDFTLLNSNILIECNGDYWHANPLLFDESDKIRNNITAKDIWERDSNKVEDFISIGYKCLVFWEMDISQNLDKIKSEIQNEYNK